MDFLLELILEFLLQALLEALAELGLHSLAEPFRRTPNPYLAAIGYALFGAAAGGLSLLFVPPPDAPLAARRLVKLVVVPLLVGLAMASLGAWRRRRGDPVLRIDRFSYGYLFALALAAVRFAYAR